MTSDQAPKPAAAQAPAGAFAGTLAPLATPLRFALGGLLIFSGWMKLGLHDFAFVEQLGLQEYGLRRLPILSPLDFAFSIKGFKMGLSDGLVEFMAYAIPYGELALGLCLFVGLWTRAAALLTCLMMVSFTAGIISIIARDLDVNCPCFGAIKLFCSGSIGMCHVYRNSGFFLAAAFLMWSGSGPLGLDRVGACTARTKS